jgi:polysaccharide biosynthesis/export protein
LNKTGASLRGFATGRGILSDAFWALILVLVAGLLAQAQSAPQSAPVQPGSSASAVPSQSQDAPVSKGHDDSFVIGNNDVLAISVWKEPDLTKTVPVRSDGKISLPLVGEIVAAGRTPLQLEGDITAKLKNFITAPEVSVQVQQVNSRKYNILGEVARPGSYPLTTAATLMDAIAAAGGFRDFAKKTGVYVLRKQPDGQESRLNFNYKDFVKGKNSSQNIALEPNDTIIVP